MITKKAYLLLTIILSILSLFGGVFLVKRNQNINKNAETTGTGVTCVECVSDFPGICYLNDRGAAVNAMQGRQCNITTCTWFDACAPHVQPGQSCIGKYVDVNDNIKRLSNGEADHGQFVGCSAVNQNQNCFCSGFSAYDKVVCYDDRYADSCAARKKVSTPTPIPTSTPIPTNTPKPSATATPKPSSTPIPTNTTKPSLTPTQTPKPTSTSTPIPTNTPKPSSTATPKPTSTPIPTNTPKPTSTSTPVPTTTVKPSSTPAPTATDTPVPTSTSAPTSTPTTIPSNTPSPNPTNTSTPHPTQYIAYATATPTTIVLPQSGIEFPTQGLTIIGIIVTLIGFLVLL